MNQKSNETPAAHIQYTSDPAKMRANILHLFDTIPDDTRDIIAQFWAMTLQEKLPEWKKKGDHARKLNKSCPTATEADPGGLSSAT